MSWEYKKPGGFGYKSFEDCDIPEGAIGFVYEMIAVVDGKVVSYIGKKNFYSSRKKNFLKSLSLK